MPVETYDFAKQFDDNGSYTVMLSIYAVLCA